MLRPAAKYNTISELRKKIKKFLFICTSNNYTGTFVHKSKTYPYGYPFLLEWLERDESLVFNFTNKSDLVNKLNDELPTINITVYHCKLDSAQPYSFTACKQNSDGACSKMKYPNIIQYPDPPQYARACADNITEECDENECLTSISTTFKFVTTKPDGGMTKSKETGFSGEGKGDGSSVHEFDRSITISNRSVASSTDVAEKKDFSGPPDLSSKGDGSRSHELNRSSTVSKESVADSTETADKAKVSGPPDSSDTFIIIGAVIGGLLFFIIVIVILVVVIVRRRKKSAAKGKQGKQGLAKPVDMKRSEKEKGMKVDLGGDTVRSPGQSKKSKSMAAKSEKSKVGKGSKSFGGKGAKSENPKVGKGGKSVGGKGAKSSVSPKPMKDSSKVVKKSVKK